MLVPSSQRAQRRLDNAARAHTGASILFAAPPRRREHFLGELHASVYGGITHPRQEEITRGDAANQKARMMLSSVHCETVLAPSFTVSTHVVRDFPQTVLREGGDPSLLCSRWTPAFAGATNCKEEDRFPS